VAIPQSMLHCYFNARTMLTFLAIEHVGFCSFPVLLMIGGGCVGPSGCTVCVCVRVRVQMVTHLSNYRAQRRVSSSI